MCFLHIPPENSPYTVKNGDDFDTLINDICKELVVCVSTKPTMSKFIIQLKNETSLSLSNYFETKPLTFHTPIERLGLFVVFVRLVDS
jgi:hypothetical protein